MLKRAGQLVSWLILWTIAICCHTDINKKSDKKASIQLQEKKWPLHFDSLSIEQHLAEKRNYFVDKEAVRKFYHLRSYKPVWFDSLGLTSQARNLIFILANASDEGIRLHQDAPGKLLSVMEMNGSDKNNIIQYDIELTARFFEYASIAYYGLSNEKKASIGMVYPIREKRFRLCAAKCAAIRSLTYYARAGVPALS